MRILMFGWEFPPYMSGGLGTACYDMTQALARARTDIIFIQPQVAEEGGIRLENNFKMRSASGVHTETKRYVKQLEKELVDMWKGHLEVRYVDSLLRPYHTKQSYADHYEKLLHESKENFLETHSAFSDSSSESLHGGYGSDLMQEVFRYSRACAAIALEENYDVIHAHDWMTYPAAILAKKLTGKPLVVHAHSLEYDRSGQNINGEVAHIEWSGFTAADHIIAVSYYTKSLIVDKYKIPPDKITVVHNAVKAKEAYHCDVPELCREEKRVLFLGRVTFQKGPDYFVEAAKLVAEKIPNVRFIMAGSGDMLTKMIRRVGQLRLGSRFHFTGFMRGRDVDRLYALSDLYVMPSVSEPFGITPLEAMSSDVPVIISNQSGVSEVLQNALKVDFWDVKELANKICAVLSYPVLSKSIVANCHRDLKSIKWEKSAELINKIYEQIK